MIVSAEPDRLAMIDAAGAYLDAMAARDPGRVPFSPGFRSTENAVDTAPGAGLWRRTVKVRSRQVFADPVSGNIALYGAVDLDGALHPYALRLRMSGGLFAEAEMILSASTRGHFAAAEELLRPDVLYDAPVPAERACRSRDALQLVAQRYWTALNESDGSLAPFGYRCDRYANGKRITNNLELLLSPDKAVHTPASLITATRPARPKVLDVRFPVLDPTRGLAISFTTVEFGRPPDGGRSDVGAFYIFGVSKVVDDEFRMVDHIHEILPTGTVAGW